MRKLIEGLPFYQDKLHDEEVFTRFSEILTKVSFIPVTFGVFGVAEERNSMAIGEK